MNSNPPDIAVVGVGYTDITSNSGRSTLTLAVEAVRQAIDDAGLEVTDVDGIMTYALNDSVHPMAVAAGLGLSDVAWFLDWFGGGTVNCATLGVAQSVIQSGLAKTVVLFRSLNGRSGVRLGGFDQPVDFSGARQLAVPSGYMTYAQHLAMWSRRHMEQFGTTREHLGAVAIKSRQAAMRNPRARMRKPLTLDDYFAADLIADPFCVYDMCLESDGACALVLTSMDRARDCRHVPVKVASVASGSTSPGMDNIDDISGPDMTRNFTGVLRDRLFGRAGITISDVDVAQIYDCFTHTLILSLEGLGIAGYGEGGDYVKQPDSLVLGGPLPVNTHGGLLSEGYLHGLNHVAEAVIQLRGEADQRQVEGAEVALVTGGATTFGSAAILQRWK